MKEEQRNKARNIATDSTKTEQEEDKKRGETKTIINKHISKIISECPDTRIQTEEYRHKDSDRRIQTQGFRQKNLDTRIQTEEFRHKDSDRRIQTEESGHKKIRMNEKMTIKEKIKALNMMSETDDKNPTVNMTIVETVDKAERDTQTVVDKLLYSKVQKVSSPSPSSKHQKQVKQKPSSNITKKQKLLAMQAVSCKKMTQYLTPPSHTVPQERKLSTIPDSARPDRMNTNTRNRQTMELKDSIDSTTRNRVTERVALLEGTRTVLPSSWRQNLNLYQKQNLKPSFPTEPGDSGVLPQSFHK